MMPNESLLSQKYPWNPVLWLTLKSSMDIDYSWLKNRLQKLSHCGPKKSSKKPSSTVDADIFYAYRLLLTEKPLMKTESLLSQKSSKKPSSTADDEIFTAHRLLPTQKLLTKIGSLGPKNHPRSLVLRSMLTCLAHIDYCWLRNRSSKLRPCCLKKNSRNLVLRLTLKSSEYIEYCWDKLVDRFLWSACFNSQVHECAM